MARTNAIPDNLVLPLLELSESGKTGSQMMDWLKTNHNIETSLSTISKRLKIYKAAQLQAKIETVRANASEKALDYISMMDTDITKLHRKTNKLLESDEPSDLILAKSLIETKKNLIMVQLNSTGMDKPEKDEQDQEFILEGLVSKLGKSN